MFVLNNNQEKKILYTAHCVVCTQCVLCVPFLFFLLENMADVGKGTTNQNLATGCFKSTDKILVDILNLKIIA